MIVTENIKLDYPLKIVRLDDVFNCPDGAEFFKDEHGYQWVKFVPTNGYHRGDEHIMRADFVTIIKKRGYHSARSVA